MPRFTKSERIVSQKLIDELFSGNGSHSLAAFPLRAVYMLRPVAAAEPPVQLLISVPKRRFKHAVDRNRVKRQLREAFRLSKQLLADHVPAGQQVALAFIWLSDQHQPSAAIAHRVQSLLKRIASHLKS